LKVLAVNLRAVRRVVRMKVPVVAGAGFRAAAD
jgi:hypothetical protein